LSLLQHPPLFKKKTQNLYLFPAISFSHVMAFFWFYVPKFQEILGTAQATVEHWFLFMGLGMGMMLLDETRKFAMRRWPKGFLARIAW
jgi:sodium/potassium-transporting ATPase subunit alpha